MAWKATPAGARAAPTRAPRTRRLARVWRMMASTESGSRQAVARSACSTPVRREARAAATRAARAVRVTRATRGRVALRVMGRVVAHRVGGGQPGMAKDSGDLGSGTLTEQPGGVVVVGGLRYRFF